MGTTHALSKFYILMWNLIVKINLHYTQNNKKHKKKTWVISPLENEIKKMYPYVLFILFCRLYLFIFLYIRLTLSERIQMPSYTF